MKKAVIDRDLKAARVEALALRTVVGDGDMSDEQRSKRTNCARRWTRSRRTSSA